MNHSTSGLTGVRAAIALFCMCLTLPASARTSERKDESQRYYRLGQVQFDQGKTQQAIESVE